MGIRYQLPNGKYVYLTLDQALDMDDLANFQDLYADDPGFDSDDPFYDKMDEQLDPKSWNVPQTDAESIPDNEKQQIKKDIEDGD